jgi:hypothetical protein
MQVTYATRAGDGQGNEDYLTAGPGWAVILDGATAPAGIDSGCVHSVRWLVRQLAAALTARMPVTAAPLADLLAEAISDVRQAHGGACDLGNPDSPSSTVAMCRVTGTVDKPQGRLRGSTGSLRAGRRQQRPAPHRRSHAARRALRPDMGLTRRQGRRPRTRRTHHGSAATRRRPATPPRQAARRRDSHPHDWPRSDLLTRMCIRRMCIRRFGATFR